jgi:hypothetical protein
MTRARRIEKRSGRTPAASDWLARRGGWLLILVGAALIGLAASFADKVAVAPVFAIGGIALVVVGVMLPRVHGDFEFSATGFKLFLAEVGEQTQGLEPGAKAEVLDEVVETAAEGGGAPTSPEAARSLASRVVTTARQGFALEQAFARWLSEHGWTVTTSELSAPVAIDILADRPGEPPLVVEVKTALRSGAQALRQVQRLKEAAQRQAWGDQVRFAVALGERPPDGVLEKLRAVGVEVYVQSDDGFTHLV